jgi:hypothetical protein
MNMARVSKVQQVYAKRMAEIESYELEIGKLITTALEQNNPKIRESLMKYLNKAMYDLVGMKKERENIHLNNDQYGAVMERYSKIRSLKKECMKTSPNWLETFSQKYETMRMSEKDEKKYQLKKAA